MGDDAELYTDMQEPWFWDWVEGSNDDYEDDYELELVYDRYFFVDYENVNREGLNGISKLEETDCVRIYYSDAADTMTFGLHRRINASKAHFDYIKVQIPIKMQLTVRYYLILGILPSRIVLQSIILFQKTLISIRLLSHLRLTR